MMSTMADQFVDQTIPMTPSLTEITNGIRSHVSAAFGQWDERLTPEDLDRIERKLQELSDHIPMDRPYEIGVFTAFLLALLEDLSRRMKHPCKIRAIRAVTAAVLALHEYVCAHDGELFDHLMAGAHAADCWSSQKIV